MIHSLNSFGTLGTQKRARWTAKFTREALVCPWRVLSGWKAAVPDAALSKGEGRLVLHRPLCTKTRKGASLVLVPAFCARDFSSGETNSWPRKSSQHVVEIKEPCLRDWGAPSLRSPCPRETAARARQCPRCPVAVSTRLSNGTETGAVTCTGWEMSPLLSPLGASRLPGRLRTAQSAADDACVPGACFLF